MDEEDLVEATFKEISIVPDYRALQIIRENRQELEKIVSNGNDIIKDISKRSNQREDFQSFKKQLHDVEEYLKKNESNNIITSENANGIAKQLKKMFNLTKEEIVMLLNQIPISGPLLETLFPGKFPKEQVPVIVHFLNQSISGENEEDNEDGEDEQE